jgi:hypothetical protein
LNTVTYLDKHKQRLCYHAMIVSTRTLAEALIITNQFQELTSANKQNGSQVHEMTKLSLIVWKGTDIELLQRTRTVPALALCSRTKPEKINQKVTVILSSRILALGDLSIISFDQQGWGGGSGFDPYRFSPNIFFISNNQRVKAISDILRSVP